MRSQATSWNGWGSQQGTCTVHTWNDGMDKDEDEPGMGRTLNAYLEDMQPPASGVRGPSTRSRRVRRARFGDDDE